MSIELEKRIAVIEERNKRVESDKAWETSWTRKILIVLLTYVIVGLFLNLIDVARPWINALVPAIGFFLSTLTVTGIKRMWLKNQEEIH